MLKSFKQRHLLHKKQSTIFSCLFLYRTLLKLLDTKILILNNPEISKNDITNLLKAIDSLIKQTRSEKLKKILTFKQKKLKAPRRSALLSPFYPGLIESIEEDIKIFTPEEAFCSQAERAFQKFHDR